MMIRRLVCLICLVFCSSKPLYASEYVSSGDGGLEFEIAAHGVNKIAVRNDRIWRVIGNEQAYILESNAELGTIFMVSKQAAGSNIYVNIITEKNQELLATIRVKDIAPQIVNITGYKQPDKELSDHDKITEIINNNPIIICRSS